MADEVECVGNAIESGAVSYEEACRLLPEGKLGHPVILVSDTGLLINDNSHGQHGPDNPDDGETSAFALALAAKMEEFGIESVVRRLD